MSVAALFAGTNAGAFAAKTGLPSGNPSVASGAAATAVLSPIKMVVTSANGKLDQSNIGHVYATKDGAHPDTIVVNPARSFQRIMGFGGAMTDASCFVFNRLSPEGRAELFHRLFAANELNLNVCRTCMGASDYSTELFSYDEGAADPDLKRFTISHDEKYVLPMLREARKVNPDLTLFSTPWSPPGWMKSNGSMLGGNMQRRAMPAYAEYFAKFLRAYERQGIPIQAVTVQNEVDTDQDGRMPACSWPQEYEVDFVNHWLGPTLQRQGIKTNIWIIDHNYNLWGRALASLEDPTLRKYVDGVAWHGYAGDVSKMTVVHDAYPSLGAHWTEGGPDYTDPHYGDDWTKWSKTFSAVLKNWCESITVWNLALDENGKPNIGPFPCGGLVTIDSKTGTVTNSGQYWALAHFSKFIKRGACRIESNGDIDGVTHVAFANPDGRFVAVLTNENAGRTVHLTLGDTTCDVPLAPNSVTTLTW